MGTKFYETVLAKTLKLRTSKGTGFSCSGCNAVEFGENKNDVYVTNMPLLHSMEIGFKPDERRVIMTSAYDELADNLPEFVNIKKGWEAYMVQVHICTECGQLNAIIVDDTK